MDNKLLSSRKQSLRALDSLNFFLADIQGGVGPFLVIFLTASLHWHPERVGFVMTCAGIVGVFAQTPAGAIIDRIQQKRLLVVFAALLLAISSIVIVLFPTFPVVVCAQSFTAIVGAFFGPTIAAISLGLVGRKYMEKRIGRNQSISSVGNVVAALLAGLIGSFIGRQYIFYFIAVMSVAVIISVLRIRDQNIDYTVARGGDGGAKEQPQISNVTAVLKDRRVLIFAFCAVLFHFANASMLPLVGEVLSARKESNPSLYMSACIIVAQLVIIPLGIWIGRRASLVARKPIYLIAFIALPIRGLLYTLSDNPYFLVSVQLLDGIGGGIFGVMQLLVIADLTKGTGRFNLTQGAIGTAVGTGASLSNLVAGFVVKYAGYHAAFLTMAAIAGIALIVFWLLMPETKASLGQGNATTNLTKQY
jgi:predicted MFS family arabinose efflux permease